MAHPAHNDIALYQPDTICDQATRKFSRNLCDRSVARPLAQKIVPRWQSKWLARENCGMIVSRSKSSPTQSDIIAKKLVETFR
jgi:hypothetical protein